MATTADSVRGVASASPLLVDVRAAPREQGTVELVVRRPAVDEREVIDEAQLDLEEGLVGDSWRARGRSGGRRPANLDAQITVMSSRAIAGDQLFVDLDLSGENLPPGTRVEVGSAVIEVTAEPHTGCKKFAARFGLETLELFNSPEGRALNLRGINARVVKPGTVRVGDPVRKV